MSAMVSATSTPPILSPRSSVNMDTTPSSQDPEPPPVDNPKEWSKLKKIRVTIILALMVFSFTYTSTAYSASSNSLQQDFGASYEVVTLGLALYVLGFALAPLLMGPLAQNNGKRPVYVWSWISFTISCFIVSESKTLPAILIFRFFAGVGGSSALNNVPASYNDMATPHRFSRFFACYGFSAFAGPGFGGLIGAFINTRAGWQWNLRVQSILIATVTALCIFFLPETDHAKFIRQHQAKYAPKQDESVEEKAKGFFVTALHSVRSAGSAFVQNVKLPFQWLFTDMVILVICIYTSLLYAIIYGFFVIIPYTFASVRKYDAEKVGLVYIALIVGFAIATTNFLTAQQYISTRKRKQLGTLILPPEVQLIHAIYGCLLAPVGLFLFAWTAPYTHIHWIVPIIGIVLLCAGSMSAFTSLIPYLVGYGGTSAPSILAAASFSRSGLAAAFPLFVRAMCKRLTVQGATSLLGGLALLLTPLPLLLYIYGAQLREHVRRKKEAAAAKTSGSATSTSNPESISSTPAGNVA